MMQLRPGFRLNLGIRVGPAIGAAVFFSYIMAVYVLKPFLEQKDISFSFAFWFVPVAFMIYPVLRYCSVQVAEGGLNIRGTFVPFDCITDVKQLSGGWLTDRSYEARIDYEQNGVAKHVVIATNYFAKTKLRAIVSELRLAAGLDGPKQSNAAKATAES